VRLIDRLGLFLERKKISFAAFEKDCGISNGYLGKQLKGKGSVGSDILEKISRQHPELNLVWLITGKGKMIVQPEKNKYREGPDDTEMVLKEDQEMYAARHSLISLLKEQLALLEAPLPAGAIKRKAGNKK
jgi:hypothetical protein